MDDLAPSPEQRRGQVVAHVAATLFVLAVFAARLSPLCGQVKQVVPRLRDCVRACLGRHTHKDAAERRVQDECDRRRLEQAKGMLTVTLAVMAFVGAQLVWKVIKDEDGPPTLAHTVLYCTQATSIALISVFRRFLLKQRFLDAIYSLFMAFMVAFIVVQEPDPLLIAIRFPNALVMSSIHGLFNMRVWLNFVWLAALACVASVKVLLSGHDCIFVINSCALLFCALAWTSHCLTASVRMEILAGDRGNQLTAVETLLRTICDVVVELDADLRLLHHCPKLADVLLRGSGRSLAGMAFQEFVDEADQESFDQKMRELGQAGACADVFHAKMRDTTGSTVSMEFFSVAFTGSDARQRRILGMREFTDVEPLARQRATRPPPQVRPRRAAREAGRLWPGTPAAMEWADVGSHSHSSTPSRGSRSFSPDSSPSSCSSSGRGSRRLQPASGAASDGQRRSLRQLETCYGAKRLSLIDSLLSWHVPESTGECCPWHRVLADAQGVIRAIVAEACDPDYRASDIWQCRRCGIAAEEYQRRGHTKCRLCKLIRSGDLAPPAPASADRMAL